MRFAIRTPAHRAFDENSSSLRIVKAAKHVFLRSADAGFSMRSVAKEAGMSMGAVQHFYPTRDQLLTAMLEYVVNEYEIVYERVFNQLPFNGEARLLGIIDYLVTDTVRQETRQFFFALWALGCHNKFAAALVDAMYVHHRRNLAAFIGAARPALAEERCFEAAMQIAALIEGLMLFTGPGTKHFPSRAALVRMVKASVQTLLSSSAAAARE
jgi:AcrR family transcriptional regulator